MISCRLLNGACRLLCGGEYRRFRTVSDPEGAQRDYLIRLLKKTPRPFTEGGTALVP